jgi:drug/metabolite transporter (DMT)-like permease
MFAAFLTTICFALSAITGRRLVLYMGGTLSNLLRLVLGALLLGAWSHVFGFGLGGVAFSWLFLSGCVGFGLGDLAVFQAYHRIGARRTLVLTQCLAAPFAALTEWAWLGHAPTLAQAGFGVLILTGVGVALMPGKAEAPPVHGLAAGICFGVVSAVGQGMGAVLSRKAYAVAAAHGQVFHGVGDGINAAYQRMLGGICVSLLLYLGLKLTRQTDEPQRNNWPKAWRPLVANCLCGPVVGVTCYQWALMTVPTNIALPIIATTPLAVLPMAHFMEGDRITRRAVLGGLLAVAGVIGLTLAK